MARMGSPTRGGRVEQGPTTPPPPTTLPTNGRSPDSPGPNSDAPDPVVRGTPPSSHARRPQSQLKFADPVDDSADKSKTDPNSSATTETDQQDSGKASTATDEGEKIKDKTDQTKNNAEPKDGTEEEDDNDTTQQPGEKNSTTNGELITNTTTTTTQTVTSKTTVVKGRADITEDSDPDTHATKDGKIPPPTDTKDAEPKVETQEGRVVATVGKRGSPDNEDDEHKTELTRRIISNSTDRMEDTHLDDDETFELFHAGRGMRPIAEPGHEPGWSEADDHTITPKNGKEFTRAEIQAMLDAELIDSISPSKTTRHAVVKNPDGAQDLEVSGVEFKNGKLYVDLKDKVKEGNVRPLDEWTDGREWPGADMEQGDQRPPLLAREIRVMYGGEVTEDQWREVQKKYAHLSPSLQHARLGSVVHARFDYNEAMSGDHGVEVILPPGNTNNTTQSRRMDAARVGKIADAKPATAGSFLDVVTQLIEYDYRRMTQDGYEGIENELTVVVYGKAVTRRKN